MPATCPRCLVITNSIISGYYTCPRCGSRIRRKLIPYGDPVPKRESHPMFRKPVDDFFKLYKQGGLSCIRIKNIQPLNLQEVLTKK